MKKNFWIEAEQIIAYLLGTRRLGIWHHLWLLLLQLWLLLQTLFKVMKMEWVRITLLWFIACLFTCPCPLTPCFSDIILRSRSTNPAFKRRYFDRMISVWISIVILYWIRLLDYLEWTRGTLFYPPNRIKSILEYHMMIAKFADWNVRIQPILKNKLKRLNDKYTSKTHNCLDVKYETTTYKSTAHHMC